jgi:hypothetical protein
MTAEQSEFSPATSGPTQTARATNPAATQAHSHYHTRIAAAAAAHIQTEVNQLLQSNIYI